MFPTPKTPKEIKKMRKGGKVLVQALKAMKEAAKPGVSTFEVDAVGRKVVADAGMKCAFFGYQGFPGAACTSVNDVVVHGIPSKDVILKDGDIIGIDFGVEHAGFNTDACISFPVGSIRPDERIFLDTVKKSLFDATDILKPGITIGDISSTVQKTIEGGGYAVVKDMTGHGIGKTVHEKPEICNHGTPGAGPKIAAGQTFAIEPIATMGGTGNIYTDWKDKWTVYSTEGVLGGHYEFTVVITDDGCEILTPWHEEILDV